MAATQHLLQDLLHQRYIVAIGHFRNVIKFNAYIFVENLNTN